MPPFRFFISTDHTPVFPESPLWQALLPTTRMASSRAASAVDEPQVVCGAYFDAVRNALSAHGCAPLFEALAAHTETSAEVEPIERVDIQLLKHGQFYHPSKIVVQTPEGRHHLALNLAFSSDGLDLMPREIAALQNLGEQGGGLALPRVLAQGECVLETASTTAQKGLWFLGPWFEGFHEFHLTRHRNERLAVTVWDDAPTPTLLQEGQMADLLEGAARLLATAVNPHTLAHIFPWHHAAGDFVVHLDPAGVPEMRLITVRDYQPLIPPGDNAEAALDRLLQAQMLLLVQVALRLRVDRLDGVGEIALYPPSMVTPICRGLLTGLARMRRRWRLPAELDVLLVDSLGGLSPGQLFQLNQTIQGGFALESPERTAISAHLETHAQALFDSLQKCLFCP